MARETRALACLGVVVHKGAIEVGINLSTIDRVIRGVAGAALIAVGLLFVKGVGGIVLCLVGAILIFSGGVGFCHVYKVFHIRTSRKA